MSLHETAYVLCPSTAWRLAHRLLWMPHCLWLHNAPSKSIKWLKTTPLGDVGVDAGGFRGQAVGGGVGPRQGAPRHNRDFRHVKCICFHAEFTSHSCLMPIEWPLRPLSFSTRAASGSRP